MFQPQRRQIVETQSLPAPVGGLNARDALAAMPVIDAIRLDNWFPSTTSVDLRAGYSSFSTFTGDCETVILYHGGSEIFVAVDTTDNAIIDATAGGAISTPVVGGVTPTVQTVSNARFDYVNFGNTSGQYIMLVNGADTILQYNGTTWAQNALTGPTHADVHTLAVYAERIWLAGAGFDVWYGAVNAIAGAFTQLNLGSFFAEGGSLAAIITFSADTSSQVAEYIAFVSTEGEILVYTGDNPASADTWGRVGLYKIGRPATTGQRTWAKLGAEAVLITADGAIPLSAAIMQGRLSQESAISDKIRNLFNRDIKSYGSNFGWSAVLHTDGQKFFVNVPSQENSTSYQYTMNTQTKAWSRFTGWNAFCMAATKDTLYWGGSGILAKGDTGTSDAGSAIVADSKQAYTYFDARGQVKMMTLARPILELDGPVSISLGVDVDYGSSGPYSVVAIPGGAGDPWEVAWDAEWTGTGRVYSEWGSVAGVGTAIAFKMKLSADEVVAKWQATDLSYQRGAVL